MTSVTILRAHPEKLELRIGKNIEYILATFRGAVNLKDIATFRRGGAPYVDQYFGASRVARDHRTREGDAITRMR